jgi:hypothetical protein
MRADSPERTASKLPAARVRAIADQFSATMENNLMRPFRELVVGIHLGNDDPQAGQNVSELRKSCDGARGSKSRKRHSVARIKEGFGRFGSLRHEISVHPSSSKASSISLAAEISVPSPPPPVSRQSHGGEQMYVNVANAPTHQGASLDEVENLRIHRGPRFAAFFFMNYFRKNQPKSASRSVARRAMSRCAKHCACVYSSKIGGL